MDDPCSLSQSTYGLKKARDTEQFRWGREQGLLMVRRKRMGCREGFGRRKGFIMEIQVVKKPGWNSWRLRQKCLAGGDADVGTSGSRGSTGNAGGVENCRGAQQQLWSKDPSGQGLWVPQQKGWAESWSSWWAGKAAGARRAQGKVERQRGEGNKSISEKAEWMCGGNRRSTNTPLQRGGEVR